MLLGFEDDKVIESDTTQGECGHVPAHKKHSNKVMFASGPINVLRISKNDSLQITQDTSLNSSWTWHLSRVDLAKFSTPEEKVDYLIKNKAVAVRLVPTRNTSFQHLRDAYIRAVQGRITLARQAGTFNVSSEEEDAIQDAVQDLKATFPQKTLQKRVPFYLVLSAPESGTGKRTLSIPTLDGTVGNTWVGVELMRAYFQGDGPSPKMKQSVMEGVQKL
ncbi:hypothetical protein FRB99_006078 [Tulasnella sp. 403]|nr:hypothetical protein FRB99_006078 [Tulasnella sp. 403]